MNKRFLMFLSGFILAASSSVTMAEPCPHDGQCQNSDHNQKPKTHQQPQQSHQQPQQAHQQKQQKQQKQKQPAQSHAPGGHEHRTVKVKSARLRSGPGTNYPVVKGLRKGDRVEVIKIQNNWVQVRVNNTLLWIAASLLSAD